MSEDARRNGRSTSMAQREKAIRDLIVQNPVPLEKLRALALAPGDGFCNNALRSVIWPKLLGLNRFESQPSFHDQVARNQWSDQIGRDVARSLWHYHMPHAKKRKRGSRRRLLAKMINALMSKHPTLHYYQGFHDVLSVLVLVMTEDDDLCFAVAERVALYYLGDYTRRPDFSVLTPLLELLLPLVEAADGDVGACLRACGIHAYVCLPWVIAWWAHDCHNLEITARLFDAFLSGPPLFPLYLAAAMILEAKTELFALEDKDFSAVHSFLSRLASRPDLPVETLIARAHRLLLSLPPAKLVRLHGHPFLRDLARKKEVHALNFPHVEWYKKEAPPDWLLREDRRREEGRSVRCKHTRQRRRQAYLAGVQMPSAAGVVGNEKKGALWSSASSPPSSTSLWVAAAAVVGVAAVLFKLGEGDLMELWYNRMS
ncbi:tbc domain-containing protein [Nannochloropsis oceanica]